MLPFLEPKRTVSLLMEKNGQSSEVANEKSLPDGDGPAFRSLAEDMISAIQNKSVQDLASCLKSMHSMMSGDVDDADESLEYPSEG